MRKLFWVLKLFFISMMGATIGWLSGLAYFLNTIPTSHLPTHVSVKIDTVFFTLLPLSILFFWEFRKNKTLLIASQVGVISGRVVGYQIFPSATMTLETRLDYLFQEPWNYDIPFYIAFGGAISAFCLTCLVSILSSKSVLQSGHKQFVDKKGQNYESENSNTEA